MPWFWNAFYFVATGVLGPRWTWRAVTRGDYLAGLWQKLCGKPPILPDNRPVIWMHAVCIGEVLLLRPLIEHLQQFAPDHQVVLSTFSRSGWEAAKQAYPTVAVFFIPFDFTWTVRRVYRALRPRLLLLSELELWPNLLLEAGRRSVPVVVASSRINDADLQFYRRINRWQRPALRCITWWGAQTPRDAQRILELLGPDHTTCIEVTGSLKYDAAISRAAGADAAPLRILLGYSPGDRVLVAGSTHEPEEQMLLDLVRRIRHEHPELRLLIAPRERGRFAAVAKRIARSGLSFVRRSTATTSRSSPADVTLVDSVGELPMIWAIADFALIGGTWATGVGGQNPIEPAALGKPICFGPHVWNFDQAAQGLLDARAAVQCQTPEELASTIKDWLAQPKMATAMGRAAAEYVHSHQGAAKATIRAVDQLVRFNNANPLNRM